MRDRKFGAHPCERPEYYVHFHTNNVYINMHTSMRTSIRELRQYLSDYIRRAENGEEIIITSHNRPLAKLVPIGDLERTHQLSRQEFVAELENLRDKLKGAVEGINMSEVVINLRQEERY